MQSIAVTDAPGVVVPGSFRDALEQVAATTAPIRDSLARFQDHMRQVLADPRAVYELALHRLRDAARQAVDAITTRQGRAYLDGDPTTDTATSETLLATLGHVRPRWHQRTTERVTCLQAPRAQLPRAAA